MTDIAQIESALYTISPNIGRNDWVKVLMAVKSELGEGGRDLCHDWSARGETFNEMDFDSTWRSINADGGIKIATLFHMAPEHGWKGLQGRLNGTAGRVFDDRAKEAQGRSESRRKAEKVWAEGEPAKSHEYTDEKQLPVSGLRCRGVELLIPLYDSEGRLTCLQTIDLNREPKKKFLAGCKASGTYHPFEGPDNGPLVICEGWATGKSINLAGFPVAAAMSSGNLEKVAGIMRGKFPERRIIIAPDNDASQHAVKKAEKAAELLGCSVVVPQFSEGVSGTDFDDIRRRYGLDEIKRQLLENSYLPRPRRDEASINKRATGNCTVDDLVSRYGVTEEDVAGIQETSFLYGEMIPRGHMIAVVGLPGAGKTTVFEYIAAKMEGRVIYINADISAGDVPEARRRAIAGGYDLLCPDLKVGLSMDDVIEHLQLLAQSDQDLSGDIFIIDTLKKINDVISKGQSAHCYKLLRSLTGRGATVICLGHCNKYPDKDGWPVYEGTSDLRSDFDELALLHAHKGSYGEILVSLYWDEQGLPWGKARAAVQPQSWIIDRDDGRTVIEADEWSDTVVLNKEAREALQTSDVIREIYNLLVKSRGMLQGQILDRLQGVHGERVVRRVLKRQEGKSWTMRVVENNGHLYEAISNADIPAPKIHQWSQPRKVKSGARF